MPAVVLVAAVGLLSGRRSTLATGQSRADLRAVYQPPLHIGAVLNPLTTLKSQLHREPAEDLFTVRVEGGPAGPDRVRLAALEEYDGALWTSTDRYLVAGRTLAGAEGPALGVGVRCRVTILGLTGPYLPTIGWPTRLDPAPHRAGRFGFNEESGVLVTDADALSGLSYGITGVARADEADLSAALPSGNPSFDPFRFVPPDPPRPMEVLLHRIADGPPRPFGKLKAIEKYLSLLPYDPDARPGHSYVALNRFLGPRREGEGTGYAEQHAAAFAVLARMLGFPARIAVGYRLHDAVGGTYHVTTKDAHAWPEVHLDGYGWVALRADRLQPDRRSAGARRESSAGRGRDSDADSGAERVRAPGAPPPPPPGEPTASWFFVAALGLGGVVGLAVVVLIVVVGIRLVRRYRRRHTGDPADRVAGAWAEVVDHLRYRRLALSAAMTPTEVAREAASVPAMGRALRRPGRAGGRRDLRRFRRRPAGRPSGAQRLAPGGSAAPSALPTSACAAPHSGAG